MKTKLNQKQQGFTIIEIVIVLAIAAMILLIVFLAVPALQRSQRNNARKNDASRTAASLVEFTSNNSTGALPDSTTCDSFLQSIGSLSQYSFGSTCAGTATGFPGSVAADKFYLATDLSSASATAAPTAVRNAMILAEQATCNGTNKVNGGTSKQTALLYSLESGSSYTWACINPQ